MSVYVDELMNCLQSRKWPYRKSCHLVADSIKELAAFSVLMGLKKEWFQNNPTLPHFDLTEGMRRKAVSLGAIEIDRQQMVEIIRKNRTKEAGK